MSRLDNQRILLIHPLGYRPGTMKRDIARLTNVMAPIGLAGLAAWLEKHGLRADILDGFAEAEPDEGLRDRLRRDKPGWVGFSCSTSTFPDGVRLSQLVREILPDVKTVFGGPHVSALKERILRDYPSVDFVVVGEGEETLLDLMRRGRETPGAIPGLVFRDAAGEVRFTGSRESGLALDSLPFPAYEKLKGYPGVYKLPPFNYPRTPTASCISSRGCPYACSYCDRSVFRRTFRYNSAEYMAEHMRHLKEQFGIRHVLFYDDQFTFNRKRVETFCRMLIDQPLGMTFSCAVRAEHVDADLLRLMKEAGCWMASIGIETGDESLLARHRQNANLDMLAETIRAIRNAGIRAKGLMMMGLPGESEDSIRRSMDYTLSLPLNDMNVAKFTPFPGAPLYETIREQGEFDEDWAKMDCMNFQFIPRGMSRGQLERLFLEFYKRYFMRPRILWGYVAMIRESPDSWRRVLQHAPDFARFARSTKQWSES